MIGRLVGIIADKGAEGALIDVHGIGYEVELPLSTLAGLPPVGEKVSLAIHTHVREDDIRLFGFAGVPDRTAFRTMLKVSGVGPKLALAVLGGLTGGQLAEVIQNTDVKRLCAVPGIGKKKRTPICNLYKTLSILYSGSECSLCMTEKFTYEQVSLQV